MSYVDGSGIPRGSDEKFCHEHAEIQPCNECREESDSMNKNLNPMYDKDLMNVNVNSHPKDNREGDLTTDELKNLLKSREKLSDPSDRQNQILLASKHFDFWNVKFSHALQHEGKTLAAANAEIQCVYFLNQLNKLIK